MGAKRPLNGTSKVNTHTHVWKFRLIESIGPEGRCFENLKFEELPFSLKVGCVALTEFLTLSQKILQQSICIATNFFVLMTCQMREYDFCVKDAARWWPQQPDIVAGKHNGEQTVSDTKLYCVLRKNLFKI